MKPSVRCENIFVSFLDAESFDKSAIALPIFVSRMMIKNQIFKFRETARRLLDCVVVTLYPPCRWFAALKRHGHEWWRSYL